MATYTWIVDHQKTKLPTFQDDGGTYTPFAENHIERVLWDYLRPKPFPSPPEARRLAMDTAAVNKLRANSMTICPTSDQTYRINSDFSGHDLWALINNQGAWLAHDRDRQAHKRSHQQGSLAVDINGILNPDGPGGKLAPGAPYWVPYHSQ